MDGAFSFKNKYSCFNRFNFKSLIPPKKLLTFILQPNASLVYQSELSTMIGVSVATMVTAVMMVVAVCLCYKRHRRHVVLRDGYEKLLTEGDES